MKLIILIPCVLLSACSLSTQHSDTIQSNDETHFKSQPEAVYLKPYNDYRYLPQTDFGQMESHSGLGDYSKTQFQTLTLNNGLKVYILPRHDLPLVNISAVIEGGKSFSSHDDEILSPLVLKLLKQGTEQYPKDEFQRQQAQLGAVMQYRQTSQLSILSVAILPQDLALAMKLISQQLAHIKPEDNALGKVIEQQLLENKLSQSSGFYQAKRKFYQLHYPENHPYYSQEPTSEQIKKVSLKQLIRFYKTNYTPERTALVIVGDVKIKYFQGLLEHVFSLPIQEQQDGLENIQPMANKALMPEAYQPKAYQSKERGDKFRIDIIDRNGAQQVNILYGTITVEGTSSDKTGLDIIATLLGGGPNSRLFADLREKKGLTYSISAYQLTGRYPSPFFIQTSVNHKKVIATIDGIKNHINYLCQNKVDENELEQIKQQLLGELVFRYQTNQQWLDSKIQQLEIEGDEAYITQRINEIKTMNPDKLFTITKQYLCQQHQFIVVGQKEKLTEILLNE